MPRTVRYVEGPGGVTVEGHRFRPGAELEVPDELAEELLSGSSERLEGYTFEAVEGAQGESTTGPDT